MSSDDVLHNDAGMKADSERPATQSKDRVYKCHSTPCNPSLAWIHKAIDVLRFSYRGLDERFYIWIAAEHAVKRNNVCRRQRACQVHEISVVVR